jgi:hypothetical protein
MRALSAAALFLLSIGGALAGTTPAPEGAKVYIVEPKNGALVQSPVKVVFGATGIGVAPAGTQKENTGHHHLLIDTGLPPLDQPIPSDATHKHFGGGQTEVLIELTPGQHTLQLLLADFAHIPHNPPLASEPITITVK